MNFLRALAVAALLLGVVLAAAAWRDGRPDYQCGCSCDRAGNQIPPDEWSARTRADDDRASLLTSALLAAVGGTAISLVGVIVSAGRRIFFARTMAAGIVVGLASLWSVVELVPCAGY
jgi:hypothetical protein